MEASAESIGAWATWPMPNSAPGLPNGQSFDTVNEIIVLDRVTGLMWQRNLSAATVSLADAKLQCARLNLAGYDDWRLPSRIELVSILDLTRVEPAIDVTAFPQTPSDWFWTSSLAANDPQAAWYVYFYFGYPKTDIATNKFSSRCVRTAYRTLRPKSVTTPDRHRSRHWYWSDLAARGALRNVRARRRTRVLRRPYAGRRERLARAQHGRAVDAH